MLSLDGLNQRDWNTTSGPSFEEIKSLVLSSCPMLTRWEKYLWPPVTVAASLPARSNWPAAANTALCEQEHPIGRANRKAMTDEVFRFVFSQINGSNSAKEW